MRPLSIVLGLVLASGCHKLFDLETVSASGDGGSQPIDDARRADGSIIQLDAPPSACPITPVVYDEDLDGVDDRCDGCPTVSSDVGDTDSDGLPNACDADLSKTGDKILLAATFAQQGDLTNNFEAGAATWSAGSRGRVFLGPGTKIETLQLFAPTRVVMRVSDFTANSATAELSIESAMATCVVTAAACSSGTSPAMCVRLKPAGTGGGQVGDAASALVEIDLTQRDVAQLECTVRANASSNTNATSNLGVTTLAFAASFSAGVQIDSIVIYGAK